MVNLLGLGKDICHSWYSDYPLGLINQLNSAGYRAEYWTDGDKGTITYPNYREADEIASDYVGAEMMISYFDHWEYLGEV